MEKKIEENILGTEKIGKLLAKFAVPGIVALVINALYNIVDQIFIGQGVGYLGNGATNVIFPLTTFAMAFSLMIGDGTASFLSLMLGKKETHRAAQGTAAGLIFTVVSGIVIGALYLIFLEPLCRLFGATDAIMPYALDYGRIISVGIPFLTVCTSYASIIRSDGSPKYNMIGLLAGCVINLIGDPVFIFVFKWGVKGAAWATILGQIVNAIINFAYIPRLKSVKIAKEDVKSSARNILPVLKLGVSSFISQMVLVVVMAVQNNVLKVYGSQSRFGADIPISALGVTMKVFSILMVIVIGLASGAQPIWGYNYGARQYKRVQKTFNIVIIISTVIMCIAFALFQLYPMAIISIFGSEDAVYNEFAKLTLRVFLLAVPVAGFQLSAGIFFQAVGRPIQASLISLSKQIIFMIPAMLILSPIIGVEGVLWAGPVADILSFILTVLMLTFSWKKIFGKTPNVKTSVTHKTISSTKEIHLINEKPLVITIDRQHGAMGRAIGKKLAEVLDIPYYDSENIRELAEESGLNAMYLAFVDEVSFADNTALNVTWPYYANTSSELSVVKQAAEEAQSAVIQKISANGSCVIVGHRAELVLKNKAPLFKVFLTTPISQRVINIMNKEGINSTDAEKEISQVDKRREAARNFTDVASWAKAENYDLCIDVSTLGLDNTVELIKNAVQKL